MTTTAPKITYRKTKSEQWVAFGPVDALHVGTVTITKRDGSVKTETVERIGKTFTVNGVDMAYGYLAPRAQRPTVTTTTSGYVRTTTTATNPATGRVIRTTRISAPTRGGICDECQQPRKGLTACRDSSGLSGMCCPRCASMDDVERSFA